MSNNEDVLESVLTKVQFADVETAQESTRPSVQRVHITAILDNCRVCKSGYMYSITLDS